MFSTSSVLTIESRKTFSSIVLAALLLVQIQVGELPAFEPIIQQANAVANPLGASFDTAPTQDSQTDANGNSVNRPSGGTFTCPPGQVVTSIAYMGIQAGNDSTDGMTIACKPINADGTLGSQGSYMFNPDFTGNTRYPQELVQPACSGNSAVQTVYWSDLENNLTAPGSGRQDALDGEGIGCHPITCAGIGSNETERHQPGDMLPHSTQPPTTVMSTSCPDGTVAVGVTYDSFGSQVSTDPDATDSVVRLRCAPVSSSFCAAPGVDLSIQKSGPSSVVRGNVISYTLTAFNAGPGTATNVTIADPIPSGLIFNASQSSQNCIQNGANILCNNLTLASGQSATVTVAFDTPVSSGNCSQTTINNRASVNTSATETNPSNNQSQTVQTTITCPVVTADLSIQKSGPSSVVRGNVISYTMTAFNAGPATANNVTIADPIPAGLTFNAGQSSQNCVQNGSNILCNNLTLTAGQSATVTITFNTQASSGNCSQTTVNNRSSVNTSSTDPNPSNNQSQTVTTTITCPVNNADLSVAKSGPSFVVRGGVIAYTVTAFNAGPATATNVTIADTIPAGLTFNAAQSSQNCVQNGSNVLCNNLTLANGQNATVTIAFNTSTSSGICTETTVSNTASVNTSATDPNPSNNQSNAVTTTITCPQSADLSLIKSGPSSVVRGNVISYTVTATNAGPSTANGVTITDPIPAGLTFNASQSSPNCAQNGSNIVCNNINLTNGQSATVTIAFNTPASSNSCTQTSVQNSATVSSTCADPNPRNNQSNTVTTTITCPVINADLSITKSGPSSVMRGDVISYTLTATNAGPATANNVTIADPIPSGLTFNASQSSPNCIQNGSNILCNNLTLTAGQSATVTIAFNTTPAFGTCTQGTVNNRGSVSTSSTDPNPSNNQSNTVTTTLTCPIVNADLSITKSGPATILRGGVISYTLTATNAGPATANNVTIADPIPSGLTFNPSQSSPNCIQNGSNILCNNLTLTAGQSATVTIAFNTTPATTGCRDTTVTNRGSVSTSSTDPNPSNNQSNTVSTVITCPIVDADLSITKSGPSSVMRGDVISYTLTATNAGPATANNVTIADPIPSGLTFNAAQSSQNCIQNGSNILCNNLTLTAGQSATVTIAFNTTPASGTCTQGTVNNRGSVSTSSTDPNPSNNQSNTVTTTITCPIVNADLSITKSGPATILRGGVISYTLTATNAGPATANNVTIADPIPSGLTFNPSQSSPNCIQNGSNILCNNLTLTAGQSATVTIAFNTTPATTGCRDTTVTNRGSVSTSSTDPNPSNNQSNTVTTTITCPIVNADLSITKSGPATILRGGVISYTLTATNAGPATANNVTIADPIPSGLTFNPSQSSPNCIQNGANILCNNLTLTAGQSATVTIAFNTAAATTNCRDTTVTNRGSVSTSSTDPNPSNNQSNTVTTVITCPIVDADLSITKSGPSTVLRGTVISYTVTATNAGPATANNVTIADPIPAGLTFNPAQSSPNCIQNGVNILCNNLTLTAGQSATVTIAFNTPTTGNCTQTTVNNRASVSTSSTDPNPSNNQSNTVQTTITCPIQADLSIVKRGPATVLRGGVILYTLTATNAGPSTATNVVITDAIPSDSMGSFIFNPSQSSPNCVQNGSNIVCTIPSISSGQSASVTIAFTVPVCAVCAETTVTNSATVSSAVTDQNPSNNQSNTVTTTVTCPIQSDLSIVKSGPSTVVRGGVILYTVTATNAGPSTANSVVITDPIPAGLSFNPSQSSPNCSVSGSNVRCTIATLGNGQSSTVTIAFNTTPASGNCTETTVNNTASVSNAVTDPNSSNNQSNVVTTTITCPPRSDLSITKSGPSTVVRGDVISYTLTATNAGPSTANNVTIADPIPAGLIFNPAQSSPNCVQNGSNILCDNLTLSNGQTATVTIAFNTSTTGNCSPTTVTNRGSVSTSTTDPNPSNNQSNTVTTNITCPPRADVSISKRGPATIVRGNVISYTLTATNAGPNTATNVVITDAIPSDSMGSFIFNPSQSSPNCVQNGSNIVCTIPSINNGQSASVTLAFTVPVCDVCTETTVNNSASVTNDVTDQNQSNNQSNVVTTTVTCPSRADLSIVKNGPATVVRGGVISYTMTATNAGPTTATSVVITDPIPAGLSFNASQSSPNCSVSGANIRCNIATLTNGQSSTVTIAFNTPTLANCTETTVNNTASVSNAVTDPNLGNNQSNVVTTTITCPARADLSITKSGPSTIVRGDVILYTLTATNAGPSTANNVTIADAIPAGLTFNPTQSSPNCIQNGPNILCDNLTLTAGQSATVTIAFNTPTITNCSTTTVTNRGSVSTSTTDPNPSNNQSNTVTTTITCPAPQADLSIVKSGPSTVLRGGVVRYTLSVFNAGPNTATNVTIADPIPAGLTFNASQSSGNCIQNGSNILCNNLTLTNGQSATVTIAFNVPAVSNCTETTIENNASVSTSATDPNPSNNQSQTVQTTVTCPVITADLSVVKSGPSSVMQGGTVVYTLSAFNAGPATANNVTIADPIPAGLTFNASQSSSNCIQNGSNILCDNLTLTNGQSATVTIAFNVPTVANCTQTTITNRASVSTSTTDPNPSNNQSQTVTTTVTCPALADLSIVKSGPLTVVRGGVATYTVSVFNAGPGVANNVTINDPIPAGLTFNASQSSSSCVQQGLNIVCNALTLQNGQSATVTIAFNVPTLSMCGHTTVHNTATVNTTTTDPNPSNNRSETVQTTLKCPMSGCGC